MGWGFRKSIGFGPFRLNFSKSGIGTSVGVRGARVGINSRGQKYHQAGLGGIYHRGNHGNIRNSEQPGHISPITNSSQEWSGLNKLVCLALGIVLVWSIAIGYFIPRSSKVSRPVRPTPTPVVNKFALPAPVQSTKPKGKYVRGYYRKDGTYVHGYTRRR